MAHHLLGQPNIAPTRLQTMTQRIHLSIVQPAGYIHSQGFLDQARYARYQLRRLGAEVTIGKNRLREDAVNIIFGAHLGFAAELRQRHTCVFFNLEQLGEGGARVSQAYMDLLGSSAVIDYDARNLAAYGCQSGDVPVVSFQYAPYLAGSPALPLQDRPIDLLFFGSMNERRKAMFERIEACGWSVSRFDHPLYGDERDQFIRQSKAVFNCHFYESSRFEQARAFHTLSLGTPVVSERTARTTPPPAFEDAISWVRDEDLEAFFTHEFMTPQWQQRAEQQLQAFAQTDASDVWQIAHGYCQALWTMGGEDKAKQIWQPTHMNLGSGKDYKPGWLNVDILERAQPDLVLDLGQEVSFPVKAQTLGGGHVVLQANSLDAIYANNVLEHVPDLPRLMTNLLALLKEDGEIELEVPFEKAITAWQDPTHLRAMNLNSWLYYTNWFWYLGWFEHRFEMAQFQWLDSKLTPCEENQAAFMRVKLKKVCTTAHEKSIARTMQPDFGGVASDPLEIAQTIAPQVRPAAMQTGKVISITRLSSSEEGSHVDHGWLEKLPRASSVLALGLEARRLKNAYLNRFPNTSWADHDETLTHAIASAQVFDLLLIGPDDAASPDLAHKLEQISDLLQPQAAISIALHNAASQEIIDTLINCDTTSTDLQTSALHNRETPAHVYKILLDAGWSPSVKGHQPGPAHQKPSKPGKQAERARDLISMMDRFYIEAHRTPQYHKAEAGEALFTVVVPTTKEQQLKSNVMASSGLREVHANVVAIQGAHTPADAVAEAMRHVKTDWILLTHQDVYFPSGFGEQLNAILAAIPDQKKKTILIGFAGIEQSAANGNHRPAGYLIDRLHRFDHAPSDRAVSLDEFAIIMHKDSVHKIDPELGWHLWATDLCLSSIKHHNAYPRIIRLPVFHNSATGWTLPADFHKSASVLLRKYSELSPIHTLCGVLDLGSEASRLAA